MRIAGDHYSIVYTFGNCTCIRWETRCYSLLNIKCLHSIAMKDASCLFNCMFRIIICRLSEPPLLLKVGDSVISSATVKKISDRSGADASGRSPRITVFSKKFLILGALDSHFSSPIFSKFSPLFRKPLEHISLKKSFASPLQGEERPYMGEQEIES